MSVTQYLQHLERRQRSPETIRAYRSVLNTLPEPTLTATPEQIEQWWTQQDHLAPRTRARALSAARSYYEWAVRYDLINKNPTRRLDAPSLPKGAPRYFTRQQLNTLLDEMPPDLRRAVALGAWAGLRVAEAAALQWDDIDTEAMRLHIRHGKGDKSRTIGVHLLLLDALLPNTGGNVVTAGAPAMTGAQLQRRINRAIKKAGVDGTYHQLRHRFGTITYAQTGDPLAVAAAMGHASLDSTRIYAAVGDEALDRVAAAAVR